MKNNYLQKMADRVWQYKTAMFCLGAGFCYVLGGQPDKVMAKDRNNEKLKKSTPELDKMFAELQANCRSKSLLDRLREKQASTDEMAPLIESEAYFLVGTDACPGLDIPPGTNFMDTGTTIGANNTVTSVQAGCSNYTATAGPDVIYRFTLPDVGSRIPTCSIVLTPTGGTGYDPSIYTLSSSGAGCPAGTGNAATNCVNGADAGLANTSETITDAEMDAMPAGTYYLFIDSFYSSGSGGNPNRHNGPYSLNFTCTTVAPVAAVVSVGGRVTSANGQGIPRVSVSLTESNGNVRTAVTNNFGYYRFDEIQVGETYIFQVLSPKYQFSNPVQILSVKDNVADLNFEALDQ